MLDENLIPVLHKLTEATFFTLDKDFFRADWTHTAYGLFWLDVADNEAAEFIRLVLKHAAFDTNTKRLGIVARVHTSGVQFWRKGKAGSQKVGWG